MWLRHSALPAKLTGSSGVRRINVQTLPVGCPQNRPAGMNREQERKAAGRPLEQVNHAAKLEALANRARIRKN